MHYEGKWNWAAAAALGVALLSFWAVRSYQRSQLRDALNATGAFANPPLQIIFPDVVADSPANRALLEPGIRSGVWMARELGGGTPRLELLLSNTGREWFSDVGRQVTATCLAGTRQVTRILAVQDTFPSRRVQFQYVWSDLGPGTSVLGEDAPVTGQEYEGEALLLYEGQKWHALHWSTPQLDGATARFGALQAN